jgi:hypothetical protein
MQALTNAIYLRGRVGSEGATMSIPIAIFEILACAAAAGLTSFFVLERREMRHYASAKAEELYVVIDSFDQGLAAYFAQNCSLIAEGCLYSPAGDAGWSRLMRDSARARMLIGFYFPALWPQMKQADARLAATLSAMRRYHFQREDEASLVGLEQSLLDLRETMDALKHAVVMSHRDSGRGRLLRRSRPPAPSSVLSMAS